MQLQRLVKQLYAVISLQQRGIPNVVAPLGTALTQQQGWLLRKNSEQIVLSFDSDEAGLQAEDCLKGRPEED